MHSETGQDGQILRPGEQALTYSIVAAGLDGSELNTSELNAPELNKAESIELNAFRCGDNTELVLLHGLGGNLHTWDTLLPLLSPQLATLRYDLRGFGNSVTTNNSPFSHSDDLLALLNAANIPRCHLLGVSMGGGVALNFALNHPDRVKSLLLISPALVAWEWSAPWKDLWRPIVAAAQAGAMDMARQLWWQHPLFASTRNTPAANLLHKSIMAFSGEQWVRDNQRVSLPDIERLHRLCVPTLLLTGEQDMPDFCLIADVISASAAHVQRVNLAGGHMLHLEQPQACADAIQSFLVAQNIE